MSDKDVLVIGYPRSGNTWLSRLLGDMLDSPVTGWESAHPLAEEGLDRKGPYTVRQLHLRPNSTIEIGNAIHNANTFAVKCYDGERIIRIIRDPRDVAVSAWHYWDLKSLEYTIKAMGEGLPPFAGVGPWARFYTEWQSTSEFGLKSFNVHYEELFKHPEAALFSIAYFLGLIDYYGDMVAAIDIAIQRQSFAVRQAELSGSGSKYMYGETIQLKNLRKGIAGDWRNHFTPELNDLAWSYFGEMMEVYRYGRI
jgi:hypothetical protein